MRGGGSLRVPARALLKAVGADKATEAGLFVGAQSLKGTWIKVLKRSGSGKLYRAGESFFTTKGAPRRVVSVMRQGGGLRRTSSHRASRKGEPPSSDFGNLASAVDTQRVNRGDYKVGMGGRTGRIGLALEYGVNVAGTKVGKHPAKNMRIDPRPHARLAKREGLNDMRKDARRAMKGARVGGRRFLRRRKRGIRMGRIGR